MEALRFAGFALGLGDEGSALPDLGRARLAGQRLLPLSVRSSEAWQAVVDDGDTGRWHTLHAYTDLTVARPTLPAGAR